MDKRPLINRGAEEWQAIIDKQRESGQSGATYCRDNNISPACFYQWRKRLSDTGKSGTSAESRFIRLRTGGIPMPGRLVIETPEGYRIDVRDGCSYDMLVCAVRAAAGQ